MEKLSNLIFMLSRADIHFFLTYEPKAYKQKMIKQKILGQFPQKNKILQIYDAKQLTDVWGSLQ
jgi:hypothetical protein